MRSMNFSGVLLATFLIGAGCVQAQPGSSIVHDAEYSILLAQHGQRWAAEDREIDARLEALRQKHGKRPNIIHIMYLRDELERDRR